MCNAQQKRDGSIDYRGLEYVDPNAVQGLEQRADGFAALAAFASAKISEGCSCLNIQPKATTTTTKSAAAPVRPPLCPQNPTLCYELTGTQTTKVIATSTQCQLSSCKPNGPGQSCSKNSDCCAGSCAARLGVLICCKTNGVGKSCSKNTDCCEGSCGIQFGTPTCCVATGGACNIGNPGVCCSASCQSSGGATLEGFCD